MKKLSFALGCLFAWVGLAQEPSSQPISMKTTEKEEAPTEEEVTDIPGLNLYVASGGAFVVGIGLQQIASSFSKQANANADLELPSTPENREAAEQLFRYSTAGRWTKTGGVFLLAQARYQQTKKPRSLYLASAGMAGLAVVDLAAALAVSLGGDNSERLSPQATADSFLFDAPVDFGASLVLLGQAISAHTKKRTEKRLGVEKE